MSKTAQATGSHRQPLPMPTVCLRLRVFWYAQAASDDAVDERQTSNKANVR